jgi:hypothetical protein
MKTKSNFIFKKTGTRNPDSVTTVLVGVLGLASYTHVGMELAKQTLV